jgi:hypothetical protein
MKDEKLQEIKFEIPIKFEVSKPTLTEIPNPEISKPTMGQTPLKAEKE